MVPPAPPRFSMTNCWPSMSPALAYKIRAVVSAPPAGAEARPANSVRRVSFPAIVASLIFAKNSTGARPRKATLSSPPDSPHIRGDGEASQKAAKNEKIPGATHARRVSFRFLRLFGRLRHRHEYGASPGARKG